MVGKPALAPQATLGTMGGEEPVNPNAVVAAEVRNGQRRRRARI
jgi:hypothetical protein